jgi:hypothetical protein
LPNIRTDLQQDMSKYDPLRDYLAAQTAAVITLTFEEVDQIVPLPPAARSNGPWWANEDVKATLHVQCKSWQAAGYKANGNMRRGEVTFRNK